MRSLIRKQLFRTTIYSITAKGLRISTQSVFGYSTITIPYNKLDETNMRIGKAYNMELFHTSLVVLILGVFRLYYSKSFLDIWFISMLGIFACLGIVLFFPKRTVKEQKLFTYFPKYTDEKLNTFFNNLFEVRDYFLHYREIDLRNDTNMEKQFAELVSSFASGLINRQEFQQRRCLLRNASVTDFSRFGLFYN